MLLLVLLVATAMDSPARSDIATYAFGCATEAHRHTLLAITAVATPMAMQYMTKCAQ